MSQLGLGSIQQLGTLKLGTLAPGKGVGVRPPDGFVFLMRDDGTYAERDDGTYVIVEAI